MKDLDPRREAAIAILSFCFAAQGLGWIGPPPAPVAWLFLLVAAVTGSFAIVAVARALRRRFGRKKFKQGSAAA